MFSGDVIAAVATPPGKGAVGIIRISGKSAFAVAVKILDISGPPPARRAALAWALDEEKKLDRVLATFFPQGDSYTGEEIVEISAHGSPYVLERLLNAAVRAGARLARPGEFTQRAFLNGRLDLAQAEAVGELIAAKTSRAHAAAAFQLEGGLSREIDGLRAGVLELTGWVEASLDHPDEDIPILSDETALAKLDALAQNLQHMSDSFRRGRLAHSGARIAIVGRPNAGKSSLLNALLGSQRAIVSDRPGTTRDTVESPAEIEGIETVLIDTAGLRPEANDDIERMGQERTLRALARADLALCVMDRSQPLEDHEEFLATVRRVAGADCRSIAVLNKSDLPPAPAGLPKFTEETSRVEVSALKGDGIDRLLKEIRTAVEGCEDSDYSQAITSARHHAELTGALKELSAARTAIVSSPASHGEFSSVHLRAAMESLNAVLGRTAGDDVLDEIFSKFCIGK